MKLASVLKLVRKNISGMSKHGLMDQTLQNNQYIIAQTLINIMSSSEILQWSLLIQNLIKTKKKWSHHLGVKVFSKIKIDQKIV